jgi:hypothetical protein
MQGLIGQTIGSFKSSLRARFHAKKSKAYLEKEIKKGGKGGSRKISGKAYNVRRYKVMHAKIKDKEQSALDIIDSTIKGA